MTDILLVDQDNQFQRAFSHMLQSDGNCRLVGVAQNSVEALEMVDTCHPQMIFCDIMLGLENGLTLCKKIKKKFPEIALYILSNYCNFRLLQNAMATGIEEYLFKPLSRSKLFSLVKENRERISADRANPVYDELYATLEERNYKESYDVAAEVAEWLFTDCEQAERKNQLRILERGLFSLVPGLDRIQREHLKNKYEITSRIVSREFLCYQWLVEVITEVYAQICSMRYIHMNRVFRYIEENKHSEISLADLSAQAGISSGYLSRIFKKYYKISVVDYIHLRKLLKAKQYMAMSEMNISDISFLLGYSEAGYFCKIFKKYEGETPSAFARIVKR